MKQSLLTTVDNPFDPFDQFASWYNYDCEKGYNCSGKLMRIAKVTDEMSDTEENAEIDRAINEIIMHDFTGLYKKVTKDLVEPREEDIEED